MRHILPASLLRCWHDEHADVGPPEGFDQDRLIRNSGAWSAGHSVSGVHEVMTVAQLISTLADQYALACSQELALHE